MKSVRRPDVGPREGAPGQTRQRRACPANLTVTRSPLAGRALGLPEQQARVITFINVRVGSVRGLLVQDGSDVAFGNVNIETTVGDPLVLESASHVKWNGRRRAAHPEATRTCFTEIVGTILHRHPFLLLGVFTLFLFFLVAGLDHVDEPGIGRILAAGMRVLIVPMYLVWLLFTMAQVAMAGPGGLPAPLAMITGCVAAILGLAPYALADYALNRRRKRRSRERPG